MIQFARLNNFEYVEQLKTFLDKEYLIIGKCILVWTKKSVFCPKKNQ